jgi:hypothetical protein
LFSQSGRRDETGVPNERRTLGFILVRVDNRCVTSRNVVQAHERASRRLIELAEERLPMTGPANEADIRVYGAGLVARIVGTVQAMLAVAPSGRDADLNILVRAAFEHAVTFAWLAADPNRALCAGRKRTRSVGWRFTETCSDSVRRCSPRH